MSRRRATGGPFQRIAMAPGIVDDDHLAVAPALEHIPDERQHRDAEDRRAEGRHDVERLEAVTGQIVGVAARHALVAQPVLDQEGGVEADEGQPEVHLAEAFVHQPPGHLGKPEVDAAVGGEDDRPEQHVVEVRHHEVGVGDVEIQWRAGQHHPGQAARQEGHQEAKGEQHRRLEGEVPLPHGADPVEEFDAGGNRYQERHERKERQQNSSRDEHVVRPHRHRQCADGDGGVDQGGVAEHRLAGEHRDDLGDDAEER